MIINMDDLHHIYIAYGKTDLRKGIDSLTTIVQEEFKMDPFSQSLFLFCGTRNDRFKALYWDGSGFWLFYKRFEDGKMQWPKTHRELKQISKQQWQWLLDGFSIESSVRKTQKKKFY
ncbi:MULTISPECIES: IS66 family insertion sequence element accessory protein TnpB [Lactobacillales]|nr:MULTISPECIES: IS66 family insertion sequence element accessory protein TnpB [Lactobacillales]KAA9295518.1 IS66 family insertion sequence element accessory protein TnpB [Aerococcus tenax]MDK6689736.1 IS66 family insertion sequence element accessory protein TnpB [Aerococcus urinae]MDK8133811.1 IS66 family insertion sequence element accessory protein TnpB [Aerococcus urinae]MDK8607561.1 IS66 family insertion sequence element accessory protein TnpB [Lactobacillus paragasseri]MDL5177759.1 IS66 f